MRIPFLTLALLLLCGFSHTNPCSAAQPLPAYCTPVTCISSAGCISPCFCAKQQGEAYGVCSGSSVE